MFYGGCDSCHVAKAPPKSTESTTLVHPDKVCWWGEKPCKYFDIFKALTKDMLQPAIVWLQKTKWLMPIL